MGSPLQAIMSLLQAPRPRQPVTVRPDYGLTGAAIQAMQKSPYERTLRPGETRSPEDLRDMLAEVILAAGGAVVPGVGPRGQARQAPARIRKGYEKQFAEWYGNSALGFDEKGQPKTVYHGTPSDADFTVFAPSRSSIIQDRVGSHFGSAEAANARLKKAPANAGAEVGPRILPVHLSVQKPLTKPGGEPFSESEMRSYFNKTANKLGVDPQKRPRDAASAVKSHLESLGYDGIAYRNSIEDRGSTSYLVFRPEQIKSATGNRGTYSRSSADIRE